MFPTIHARNIVNSYRCDGANFEVMFDRFRVHSIRTQIHSQKSFMCLSNMFCAVRAYFLRPSVLSCMMENSFWISENTYC